MGVAARRHRPGKYRKLIGFSREIRRLFPQKLPNCRFELFRHAVESQIGRMNTVHGTFVEIRSEQVVPGQEMEIGVFSTELFKCSVFLRLDCLN